jgi:hypothetical protein
MNGELRKNLSTDDKRLLSPSLRNKWTSKRKIAASQRKASWLGAAVREGSECGNGPALLSVGVASTTRARGVSVLCLI